MDEICPKYIKGSTEDGSPIILRKNFPLFCQECEDRDVDFCMQFKDLICFNEQDPFNCGTDLEKDNLSGTELLKNI
ncbi:MAG: hypothetical protein QMD36_06625 [Candidatus Aenigmarchaeota archaeon]|nr:hypothetical protein [Candidatus Aenigmarchaeota archaeon]